MLRDLKSGLWQIRTVDLFRVKEALWTNWANRPQFKVLKKKAEHGSVPAGGHWGLPLLGDLYKIWTCDLLPVKQAL